LKEKGFSEAGENSARLTNESDGVAHVERSDIIDDHSCEGDTLMRDRPLQGREREKGRLTATKSVILALEDILQEGGLASPKKSAEEGDG
jgi:hypothetical protein